MFVRKKRQDLEAIKQYEKRIMELEFQNASSEASTEDSVDYS